MNTLICDERKDVQGKMEIKLREVGQTLDAIWLKARHAAGQSRIDLHKQISALREKQHAARTKFDELKNATDDLWEATKTAAEKTWSDLSEIMEDNHDSNN